ncbi:hypothetical protein JOD54_004195 [Actinokineospora baliensis]|uniref:hypothetical protein n=1 Tax=Actinokineospora baliensis TaxID=547056 RepID=UPI00195B024B|nr:hypothetical protein [Actinokineospora baliensis]MBM7773991.1 hypothetical protein [Actinokineospora baliensis]
MRKRYRDRGDHGALGVAGWLFAELALVLVVIAFGSEALPPPRVAADPGAPVTTTTPPTTSSPPPVTTTTPTASGLRLDTVVFFVLVPANGAGALESFQDQLNALLGPDQRIGLILLFGKERGGFSGTDVSRQLTDIVVGRVPRLPRVEQIRPYLGDEGAPGTVKVELFLMTGPA